MAVGAGGMVVGAVQDTRVASVDRSHAKWKWVIRRTISFNLEDGVAAGRVPVSFKPARIVCHLSLPLVTASLPLVAAPLLKGVYSVGHLFIPSCSYFDSMVGSVFCMVASVPVGPSHINWTRWHTRM